MPILPNNHAGLTQVSSQGVSKNAQSAVVQVAYAGQTMLVPGVLLCSVGVSTNYGLHRLDVH